jgi:MFS family permease
MSSIGVGKIGKSRRDDEYQLSYYGWIVVTVSFLAGFVGFGFPYAYNVFFKTISSEFGWSRSLVAGAFSTYGILHSILAFFAGRAVDKVGPRPLLAIAGFCLGLSTLTMSLVDTPWELYLYFGVIVSLGVACTYSPIMATVSRWFILRRGLAIGLTSAGIGFGSFAFPPLTAWLILSFGFKGAYVILGIMIWAMFIPIVIFVRPAPLLSDGSKDSLSLKGGLGLAEALRTGTFWALCFSWMFINISYWAIIVHIVLLATDRGLSILTAGSLAGLIGVASLPGRVSAGFLSDRLGRKTVYLISFFCHMIAAIWLLLSVELWMLFFFALFFGASSGAWRGVIPALPADYFGHLATGSILGSTVVMAGIGMALGPYLGGYIFDATNSYDHMILLCIAAAAIAIISASFVRPVSKARH